MGKIRMLIMDVDGTLTDGKIYISEQGEAFKAFNIKDGYGIHDMLPGMGIIPSVITARESEIVEKRCSELGIKHCYQNSKDKKSKLVGLAEEFGIHPNKRGVYEEIAYIGDDIPDIPCMRICGMTGCPADAADEVKENAHFVSEKNGGAGAVRDFIEWIASDDGSTNRCGEACDEHL